MLKILFFSLCMSVFNVHAEDDHGHAHEKKVRLKTITKKKGTTSMTPMVLS